MDAASEARLELVCPALAIKVRQMSVILADEFDFRVTEGMRSWAKQEQLYAQGRTAPGKIVTNAPPGHGWHEFGMGVDLCPDDPTIAGYQADWNLEHPAWKRLVAVGESVGLSSGSKWRTFKDWPHFQLTGKFPVSPTDEVRQIFMNAGMVGVWIEAGLQAN